MMVGFLALYGFLDVGISRVFLDFVGLCTEWHGLDDYLNITRSMRILIVFYLNIARSMDFFFLKHLSCIDINR